MIEYVERLLQARKNAAWWRKEQAAGRLNAEGVLRDLETAGAKLPLSCEDVEPEDG